MVPADAAVPTCQRTLGLLGGMSWESTLEYYRLANEQVRERLGGLHSCPLVLASVDFEPIAALQREGDWGEAGRLLGQEAARLAAAGVDLLLICANTMHKVADDVAQLGGIEILHIGDVTAQALVDTGVRCAGLLGTKYTMEQDFLRDRITGHGPQVIVPEAQDRDLVHRVIYDELCLGVVTEASRSALHQVIDRLAARGADGVVLGCTELELLLDPDGDNPVPLFPTTRLHVTAAVDRLLGG